MNKKIDIVIIGLNSQNTLSSCIESVKKLNYDMKLLRIIYVDGGSSDRSIEIAKKYGISYVELKMKHPTPGKQRNAGWKFGNSEYVQFIDSDTELSKDWLQKAIPILENSKIGAVFGERKEKFPNKSIFNFIGDLEWNPPAGERDFFGGDVLIKREALESSGGYNDNLIAGEDPECAHRIRLKGYKIIKINELMTYHDLAMYRVKQYYKRAHRSGHAFAEVNSIHSDVWSQELRRILFRGGFSLIIFFSGLLLVIKDVKLLLLSLIGLLLLIKPRLSLLKYFMNTMNLNKKSAKLYSWHASFVVIPQFIGVMRYYFGKIMKKPLKNKGLLNGDV